jgi:hypothetical protein
MYSPRWLFLFPGALMFILGMCLTLILGLGPINLGDVKLNVGTQVVTAFLAILGQQLLTFAVFTKIFAITQKLHGPNTHLRKPIFQRVRLEAGLISGGLLMALGAVILLVAAYKWQAAGFGTMDTEANVRQTVVAVMFLALGAQTIFASFFVSILTLRRR